MSLLRTTNLAKSYQYNYTNVKALKSCNIIIEAGECVAITGAKGSGKTTLLNILGGVERPTSGNVLINHKDIYSSSEDELAAICRKEIGYIYQYYNILPELTVQENIIMPTLLDHKIYDKEYFNDLSNRLQISNILSRYPRNLSGSQLQCISVARALINRPSIILADEPTHHLSMRLSNEVMDLLLGFVHSEQKTLIMVTQNPDISIFADHIIRLNRGSVIEDRKI